VLIVYESGLVIGNINMYTCIREKVDVIVRLKSVFLVMSLYLLIYFKN
jgi:hypothetical protein